MFSFFTCSASIMIKALLRQCLPCSQSQLKLCCIQQGVDRKGQKEQRSLQRRFEEGSRGGEGEGSYKSEGERRGRQKEAAEANTEKWERSRRNLEEKIKAKKKFIEQQNIIQKTALAKGENLKSADALRQNLRAVELARVTVERESKELNALQEDLARHMGKKPKNF